jgi:hypothetical protein
MAEEDPLLRLEHGLWLQEAQWDVTGAMQEYQAIINTPSVGGRVLAEARYCLAGCYIEKDCPSAALALYQTIVRLHSDVVPFGRLASERMAETTALIERNPVLPSRHVSSRLVDRWLVLVPTLAAGERVQAESLVTEMRQDVESQLLELSLVPTNEPPARGQLRMQVLKETEDEQQALAQLSIYIAADDLASALTLARGNSAFRRWLNPLRLWQAEGDWGAVVAALRMRWITAVASGDGAASQVARADLADLLQPLTTGPRVNPEVQTSLRTLEILKALEPLVRAADWPQARKQLSSELTSLYRRHSPAATVRPPNAAGLDPIMLTDLVAVLTHVVEAVTQIDQSARVERVTAAIDQALQTARKLVIAWQRQPGPAQRLQETISQLERARTEAGTDLQRARRLLRAEIYD